MTVAEALALTGVVITVAFIIAGLVTGGMPGYLAATRKRWASLTSALGALALILYIAAIWTHALTGG